MFKDRLISGIVMLIILIASVLCGGYVLLALVLFISLIGQFELYRVFGIEKKSIGVLGYVFTLLYYASLELRQLYDVDVRITISVILAFFFVLMGVYVFAYPGYKIDDIARCLFGFFYVPVMLGFIYLTKQSSDRGIYYVWLIFICSWGCDTCAYCVGKLFGKHKMSPRLSPKKSVEGAVGGIIGVLILAWILRFYMEKIGLIEHRSVASVLYSIFVVMAAFISMIGDLGASAIKRNFDIKDYGTLIPGHGGILDRFDSVIITVPIIYLLSIL